MILLVNLDTWIQPTVGDINPKTHLEYATFIESNTLHIALCYNIWQVLYGLNLTP